MNTSFSFSRKACVMPTIKSCVMGRGVAIPSSATAMDCASGSPMITGSLRVPSSFKMSA